jgi:DNA-binding transcriptional regulator PaaX
VRASTEEFLYVLLWTADSFLRPSLRNAIDPESFEAWAWRNDLGRRLAQLERRKLIERGTGRVVQLTEAGRLTALGGRDPLVRWARPWDGHWRLILFDLPAEETALRLKLWRLLRAEHFGYLQRSVWLAVDSLTEARRIMSAAPIDPESFVCFEGKPAGGESDEAIVRGAWDFAEIGHRYEEHLEVIRSFPRHLEPTPSGFAQARAWVGRELRAWRAAVERDPLLPRALWPRGYSGQRSWDARNDAFARLARRLS